MSYSTSSDNIKRPLRFSSTRRTGFSAGKASWTTGPTGSFIPPTRPVFRVSTTFFRVLARRWSRRRDRLRSPGFSRRRSTSRRSPGLARPFAKPSCSGRGWKPAPGIRFVRRSTNPRGLWMDRANASRFPASGRASPIPTSPSRTPCDSWRRPREARSPSGLRSRLSQTTMEPTRSPTETLPRSPPSVLGPTMSAPWSLAGIRERG